MWIWYFIEIVLILLGTAILYVYIFFIFVKKVESIWGILILSSCMSFAASLIIDSIILKGSKHSLGFSGLGVSVWGFALALILVGLYAYYITHTKIKKNHT